MSAKPPLPKQLGNIPKKPAPPVTLAITSPKIKEQRQVDARLVRRLSLDSQHSLMGPEYVSVVYKEDDKDQEKVVYVTEVNGTRTLDLYSGWNPDTRTPRCTLLSLPSDVCGLTNIQRLWVSHNELTSLPDGLDRLVQLKELFLHHNKFEEFPTPVCYLRSLEILWLNGNQIKAIPKEISQMRTLKRLHLDSNDIEVLSTPLCKVITLEVLYLNDNKLTTISEDIGKLSNLKRLYLQENSITELPAGICKLSSIRILKLNDNEIRQISTDFRTYKTQKELEKAKISIMSNPFLSSTPQNKLSKLSVASLSKSRRHSDQHDPDLVSGGRRPMRVSLPGPRTSEPAELHLHRTSMSGMSSRASEPAELYMHRTSVTTMSSMLYSSMDKADTLPRSGSGMKRRSTYHEH